MSEFFRFPHTPHLAWLGDGIPRDDKVLSTTKARDFLEGVVVVEEKFDGANLGISINARRALQIQNRGQYLLPPYSGQFTRLSSWLTKRRDSLIGLLTEYQILFGEWCTTRHSLDYDALPDWFLGFDVYDRAAQRFWGAAKRNELLALAGLSSVPLLFKGQISFAELKSLVLHKQSEFRHGLLEGVVIRKEKGDRLEARAKLVHPNFTQAIDEHWSHRRTEWNRLDTQKHQPR